MKLFAKRELPRIFRDESGVSLIQIVIGAAVAVTAVLLIVQAFSSSNKSTSSTMLRQRSQLLLKELGQGLRRDFQRQRPGGASLLAAVSEFTAASGCENLKIEQTLLPNSIRTIEYRTLCEGEDFPSAQSRESLSQHLAATCRKSPILRVVTTEPNGDVKTRNYPSATTGDAALICFHMTNTAVGPVVTGEVIIGRKDNEDWKKLFSEVQLGLDAPGVGIEIIPPQ